MGIARPCVFLALRRSSNQPWMVDPKLVFLEMKIGRRLSLGFGLLLLIALLLRPFEITQQQSINLFRTRTRASLARRDGDGSEISDVPLLHMSVDEARTHHQ